MYVHIHRYRHRYRFRPRHKYKYMCILIYIQYIYRYSIMYIYIYVYTFVDIFLDNNSFYIIKKMDIYWIYIGYIDFYIPHPPSFSRPTGSCAHPSPFRTQCVNENTIKARELGLARERVKVQIGWFRNGR